MGKRLDLKSDFKVAYIPLPPERVSQWRAGALLLLQLLREEKSRMETDEVMKEVDEQKAPSSPAEG